MINNGFFTLSAKNSGERLFSEAMPKPDLINCGRQKPAFWGVFVRAKHRNHVIVESDP
jgi:hypothetical protein